MNGSPGPVLEDLKRRLERARRRDLMEKRLRKVLDDTRALHLREMGQLQRLRKRLAVRQAAAARFRYEECLGSEAELRKQCEILERRLEKLGDTGQELREAFQAKAEFLRQGGGKATRVLLELSEARGELRALRQELLEALIPGRAALRGLRTVVRALGRVRAVPKEDDSIAGTNHMRDARKSARSARRHLSHFRREYGDVGDGLPELDEFYPGLVDVWLKGCMTLESQELAQAARRRLEPLLDGLRARLDEVNREVVEIDAARRELIDGL